MFSPRLLVFILSLVPLYCGSPNEKATHKSGLSEPCAQAEECIGELDCLFYGGKGFCTKECAFEKPCPEIEGIICIKVSGDYGNFCMKKCVSQEDCAEGTACTEVIGYNFSVCFPDF